MFRWRDCSDYSETTQRLLRDYSETTQSENNWARPENREHLINNSDGK